MTNIAVDPTDLTSLSGEERALLLRMAAEFYGYGSFDAPYWFIGTEPAGASLSEVRGKLASWKNLGLGPVVCNRLHHLRFGFTTWHSDNPPLEPTWRVLMLAFLSFDGRYTDNESAKRMMRKEQARRFGCAGGTTALLDLGGLPAVSHKDWRYGNLGLPELRTKPVYEQHFFEKRARFLQAQALERQPQFVWMYGKLTEYMPYWKIIANGDLTRARVAGLTYWCRKTSCTTFIATDHATAWGPTNLDWVALGKTLRAHVG